MDDLSAQLRPYDPVEWEVFDDDNEFLVAAGGDLLFEQKASLAGTEGRLSEIGRFSAFARSGRLAVDAAGTILRHFREDRSFTDPDPLTHSRPLGNRVDTGDYRVATTVLLTSPERPAAVAVRFGTRLPTTDNRVGLERDQTDFFAMLAGRWDHGPFRATAETGVGIHGTRSPAYEQSDVFVFSVGAFLRRGLVRPGLVLVGHADGLPDAPIRGVEELAELRLQFRAGGRTWLSVEVVRGLTEFSPSSGVRLLAGVTR